MAGAKEMVEQIGNIIKEMGTGQKIFAAVLLVGLIAGLILLSSGGGVGNYQVLYSSLSQEDAAEVVTKLKEMRVPYRIELNGSLIKVPANKVLETRLSLAGEGLPQGGGVGFEIFDKTSFGVTDFVQRLNYQRALQGELARTIREFSQVQEARVHIAAPKESIFIEDEQQTTASVSLRLRGGKKLSSHQVQAIVNLVSSAVPGLNSENVTVVDTQGHLLYRSRGEGEDMVSGTQLEYKMKLEKRMQNKVESMLEGIIGQGKVQARVSTDIDFNRVKTVEELYDPEGQVVRSESVLKEEHLLPGDKAKGIPGVKGDLATFAQPGEGSGTSGGSDNKNSVTRNYEISKTVKNTLGASGKITRLSVAVMVDGTYEKETDKDGKVTMKYKARSPEELKRMEEMVKNALGYDPERGDKVSVVGMSFAAFNHPEPELTVYEKLQPIIERATMPMVYLMTMLCVIIFVIKPLFNLLSTRQMEMQRAGIEGEASEDVAREEEEQLSLKPVGLNDRERIYKLAQSDPDRAADLVRRWLREEM